MAHWLGLYLFGKALRVVQTPSELPVSDAIINYTAQPLAQNSLHIAPHGLLAQEGLVPQTITVVHGPHYPMLFAGEGALGFDLLAASFYLLSRYEEYLPHTSDSYGRYAHTNAVAFKEGFLHRPLVDEWMVALKTTLQAQFPQLVFAKRQAGYLPTFDVDLAWCYAQKGFWRNAGGLALQMLQGRFTDAVTRLNVWVNGVRDPFDVYADLEALHQKHGLVPHWFFLLALQQKGYDKNIDPRRLAYQQLMQQTAGKYPTGLHGSWQAAHSQTLLMAEKNLLQSIIYQPVTANRYHYLQFNLPQGYTQLKPLFSQDYSMGYGSINGFRASTCTPFFWYNLDTETATNLLLFPLAYMEANSIFEQKDDAETALAELQRLYDAVKQVDGLFITIFHNHLMGLDERGRTWWNVYERFLSRNFTRLA